MWGSETTVQWVCRGRCVGLARWGSYLTGQYVVVVSCGAPMLLVEHCPSLPSVGKTDHGGGSGSRSPSWGCLNVHRSQDQDPGRMPMTHRRTWPNPPSSTNFPPLWNNGTARGNTYIQVTTLDQGRWFEKEEKEEGCNDHWDHSEGFAAQGIKIEKRKRHPFFDKYW